MKYDKNKAIKYFIEQKIVEILIGLIIFAVIAIIPMLVGKFMTKVFGGELQGFELWIVGLLFCIVLFMFGVILTIIFVGLKNLIVSWIESNWEKAKRRAEYK